MLNIYIYKIKGHKVKEGINTDPKFKRSKDNLWVNKKILQLKKMRF